MQQAAARHLDRVATELDQRMRARGLMRMLVNPPPVKGVYLVGAVGRGKTMLMDLFFEQPTSVPKLRAHLHEFMDEMHAAIAAFRKTPKGQRDDADPVAAAIGPVVGPARLVCLDEFQVGDITNAMLLGRLFGQLFARGVTLVATSNVEPDRLYENGLNRQLVLPFIATLKDNVEIVRLDGPTDYRRLKFEGETVFRFGVGPAVDAEMEALWLRLTGGVRGSPASVASLGRAIPVPLAAMGAARFDFTALCGVPLGARDYLRVAHAYDTLMIEHVPRFDRTMSDMAKRFILLVDTLYDRGIKLAASFAVPVEMLGADERTAAEFDRTASRLVEMQSADYLAGRREPAEA